MEDQTLNDSPRAKKLRARIDLLRKKSKENELRIRRTQACIRRTLHKQVRSPSSSPPNSPILKEINKEDSFTDQSLKRKRCEDDSLESADSANENIDFINFEIDNEEVEIKYELMDYENTGPAESHSQDDNTELDEAVVEFIKTEPEDDPLHLNSDSTGCDDGFLPGTGDNLPKLDALTVTDFLSTFPKFNKEQFRALWRQPSELIDDSIGYVQLNREGKMCTVKCNVATKTTSNHCTIAYNDFSNTVHRAICDCGETLCSHALAALVWLCKRERGPPTYWMMPMVSRDPSSMKINSINSLPKKNNQKNCTVLNEFVQKCVENEVFSPVLIKYHQDERPKSSLHRLMSEYKQKSSCSDMELYLSFCQLNISKDPIIKMNMPLSPKVIQELEYGRITDTLLLDVCQATDETVGDFVAKIMYPPAKEPFRVKYGISHSLELSLKMKIRKSSLILSHTSPIFSASPYGTTHTHVVYIKKLEDVENDVKPKNAKKLSVKDTACMQLQMFLAKKKHACYCEVLSDNQIIISIINYNEKWLIELLEKATKFWQTHIFKCIRENSNELKKV